MSRRRLRKPLFIVLLLFAVAFAVVYCWRWNIDREGRKKLNAVVAKIDASDPRWRWEDLEADRPGVPDAENSAFLALEFERVLMQNKFIHIQRNNEDSLLLEEIPPNHLLDDEAMQLIENRLDDFRTAKPFVRKLQAMPFGKRTMNITFNAWSSTWDVPQPYYIGNYLQFEFHHSAQRGLADRPYERVIALLNLGRMYGDETLLRSQTSRMASARGACNKMERALAMNIPSSNLAHLQAEFERESRTDYYGIGIRGHRGFANAVGNAIDKGRLDLHSVLIMHNWCGSRASRWSELIDAWPYTPHLPADLADCLDALSQQVAVANLPESQQQAALAAVITPPTDDRHQFTTVMLRKIPQLLSDALATRAALRCVVAGIAIERHRILTGDWPKSLDAIPKAILPEVPADPFTGQPLRFASRTDGVTVYSVGLDGFDDGGQVGVKLGPRNITLDIGFRLYNPDQRRMPPLPVKLVAPGSDGWHAGRGPEPRIVGEGK